MKNSGPLGTHAENNLVRDVAYALDVSKEQRADIMLRRHHRTVVRRQKVPSVDFAYLVPRLREIAGTEIGRFAKMDADSVNEVLDMIAHIPALSLEELNDRGADALKEHLERIMSIRKWPQPRSVRGILLRAVSRGVEVWAIEKIAEVEGLVAVTESVTPVWTSSGIMARGGAAALGSLLGEKILRSSGRNNGFSLSLHATGQCLVWVSETEWVIARSLIGKTDERLPLVFDRIPLSKINSVRKLRPRPTLARQLTITFDDGSKARFFYVFRKTLEMLVNSLTQFQNQRERGNDSNSAAPDKLD